MLRFIAIWFLLLAGFAFAQDKFNFDELQRQWDGTASQIQSAIETNEALTGPIDTWREMLSEDRAEALEIIDTYTPDVNELKAQIDTLLSAVPEGEDPNPEVSARRDELRSQLSRVEVPVLTARIAADRAERLISTLTGLQRQQFSQALLTRSSSPLLPSALTKSAIVSADVLLRLGGEVRGLFEKPLVRQNFLAQLPKTLFWLILGVVATFYLPKWVVRRFQIPEWIPSPKLGQILQGLVHNLVPLIIALLGIFILFAALEGAWIFDTVGQSLLYFAKIALIGWVIGRWLADDLINLDATDRQVAILASLTAVLGVLGEGLGNIFIGAEQAEAYTNMLVLGTFVLIALSLPIVWLITRKTHFEKRLEILDNPLFHRVLNGFRNAMRLGVLFAFLLALLGYVTGAKQLFFGLIATFMIALLAIRLYSITTSMITISLSRSHDWDHDTDTATSSMWTVLAGTFITIMTIPLLTLSWGATMADLQEFWARINNGVSIGDVRISAVKLVQIALLFGVLYLIVRTIKRVLSEVILPRTKLDVGGQTAVTSLFGYAGYSLAAIFALNASGLNLSSLAVVLGALSVGIGFGLQNIVSNFVSGIILLIERPIKKGDWISVNGHDGYVKNIAVRSTEIETFDHSSVIVPNADLVSQSVINWVHSNKSARIKVPIGVSYDADVHLVKAILLEIAKENSFMIRYPEPRVFLMNFGDSSVNFELRFFIREANDMYSAISEANFAIVEKFKAHDISIPFPQRELRIISDRTQTS